MIVTATYLACLAYEPTHRDGYDELAGSEVLMLAVFMWFDYMMVEAL